ncbi:MAG: hypothetical protein FJ276_26185 [Planctomycetes bacterium]|nr:hypothetical protein [Planctomycetota bacterium]
MNYRLPILAIAVFVLAGQHVAWGQAPQVIEPQRFADEIPGRDGAADPATPETTDGQALVARAAEQLLYLPGLTAKTRQRVEAFGQKAVGSGTYLQLPQPHKLLLRMDLKLQVGEHVTSLQQISDGRYFWFRRDSGGQTSLVRVNLRKLRTEASASSSPISPTLWVALGGLPKLMDMLAGYFAFQPARPTSVGDVPVWSLEGSWKPEVLASLLPEQRDAILAGQPADLTKLPEQLPHGVTLVLGRDQIIPYFPYVVSFYRCTSVEEDGHVSIRRQPMVTWELFDVCLQPDLSPSEFDYAPAKWEDRTNDYVGRIRAAVVPPENVDVKEEAK